MDKNGTFPQLHFALGVIAHHRCLLEASLLPFKVPLSEVSSPRRHSSASCRRAGARRGPGWQDYTLRLMTWYPLSISLCNTEMALWYLRLVRLFSLKANSLKPVTKHQGLLVTWSGWRRLRLSNHTPRGGGGGAVIGGSELSCRTSASETAVHCVFHLPAISFAIRTWFFISTPVNENHWCIPHSNLSACGFHAVHSLLCVPFCSWNPRWHTNAISASVSYASELQSKVCSTCRPHICMNTYIHVYIYILYYNIYVHMIRFI